MNQIKKHQLVAVCRVLEFAAPAIEAEFDSTADDLTFAERRAHLIHDVRALTAWTKTLAAEDN